nr:hypothetical protein [Tanacetum cinerariifolium]
TESYAEQAFWSQYSVQSDEPTHSGTTIVEVPKELLKVSKDLFTSFDQYLIDEVSEVQKIFKQMEMAVEQNCSAKSKFQSKMESVLKENDCLLKHALGVDIVNIVVNDCMNVNCLTVDACEQCVTTESELKTDFIKKENYEMLLKQYHTLEKHYSGKGHLKLKEKIKSLRADDKERKVESKTYKQLFDSSKSSRVQSKEQCDNLINQVNLKSVEVADLNASLQEKVLVITALKEQVKGKAVLSIAVSLNPIDPALLQVDVVLLIPKLRKNRTAHIDYIKHNLEEAATLRELVESERLLSPLNTPLAYACKYTRRIQELLMILQQTCPKTTDLGTKPVAVTLKNQNKQVRRTPQITKSEKPSVDTSTSPNIDSNTYVLSSTGVALVSSASGSQYKDNTKKNRIRRTLKKAKENELKDHPRKVKFSLNKASVVASRASSSVIKSVSNVNANLKCAFCNGCLFSDNHDKSVVEYINSVNASRKSKSAKKQVNRKVWKTTGKVFKTVGYMWKPTGRTFKLVGNVCPLTRIATATIVPPREPIPIVQTTDKPVVTLKQYATMMRQNKNLMDIKIDAFYNILKQNQGEVNKAIGLKKKTIVVTSDPLALITEKIKVSIRKEKVVVSSDSEGSDVDDFSKLKKITALLAKAFKRKKFYSNPTNNNLRTSSTSQYANKKKEFVKTCNTLNFKRHLAEGLIGVTS